MPEMFTYLNIHPKPDSERLRDIPWTLFSEEIAVTFHPPGKIILFISLSLHLREMVLISFKLSVLSHNRFFLLS